MTKKHLSHRITRQEHALKYRKALRGTYGTSTLRDPPLHLCVCREASTYKAWQGLGFVKANLPEVTCTMTIVLLGSPHFERLEESKDSFQGTFRDFIFSKR